MVSVLAVLYMHASVSSCHKIIGSQQDFNYSPLVVAAAWGEVSETVAFLEFLALTPRDSGTTTSSRTWISGTPCSLPHRLCWAHGHALSSICLAMLT